MNLWKWTKGLFRRDPRPIDCVFRLIDEDRPFPLYTCHGCGKVISIWQFECKEYPDEPRA